MALPTNRVEVTDNGKHLSLVRHVINHGRKTFCVAYKSFSYRLYCRWCGRNDGLNLAEKFVASNPEKRKYVESRDQLMDIDVAKTDYLLGRFYSQFNGLNIYFFVEGIFFIGTEHTHTTYTNTLTDTHT